MIKEERTVSEANSEPSLISFNTITRSKGQRFDLSPLLVELEKQLRLGRIGNTIDLLDDSSNFWQ